MNDGESDLISRRRALGLMTGAPVAAALAWTPVEARQAQEDVQRARTQAAAAFKPRFFTAHEYATVGVLVDLLIPRDERSGSATEAGVPEFMDFMMRDQPQRQTAMRGGLALLDRMSVSRCGRTIVGATDAERRALLDEIAYTGNEDPGSIHGVAFFNSFRDLTASGFWSSRMGVEDLQYQGNVFVAEWHGCPDAAVEKLGIARRAEVPYLK
jgi:gluconate 2-dehydrogenase subunit 3-like protein